MEYDALVEFIIFFLLMMSGLMLVGMTSACADTCYVYSNADQTFSGAPAFYPVAFDSEMNDPWNMHNNAVLNSRINITKEGNYSISFLLYPTYTSAYQSWYYLFKNGSSIGRLYYPYWPANNGIPFSDIYFDYAGNNSYYQIFVYNTVNEKVKGGSIFKVNYLDYSNTGGGSGGTTNIYYDMTTEQFDLMISLIAALLTMVSIMMAIRVWHFVGGDG